MGSSTRRSRGCDLPLFEGYPDTLLAMTTHARSGIERAVLGSVAGYCVRHAGVPLLLYWPHFIVVNNLGSR